jgi:ribonuclease P protein component
VQKNSLFKSLTSFSLQEVAFLFKKAVQVVSSRYLDIKKGPGHSNQYGRLLIIIPRAVGSAPQRNLIRRRLKHIFFEEQLFAVPRDWIIFVKKPAVESSYDELRQLLATAMK